jgi:hypothetical protein
VAGEHHRNSNSQILAAVQQAGMARVGLDLRIGYVPKQHLIVLPADKIREREDGATEVYGRPVSWDEQGMLHVGPEVAWHEPPAGSRVVPEGAKLGIEDIDVVVTLVAMTQTSMTDAQGRPMGRMRVLRELFREDARTFGANLGAGPGSGVGEPNQ